MVSEQLKSSFKLQKKSVNPFFLPEFLWLFFRHGKRGYKLQYS